MEEMALSDADVRRVGEYVKGQFVSWIPELFARTETNEHLIRLEEELKGQRELMTNRFELMTSRFEAMDKRFDDLIHQTDQRFEAVDKRFESMDKRFDDLIHHMDKRFEGVDRRFEDVDRRFRMLTWFMGLSVTALVALMSVYQFAA